MNKILALLKGVYNSHRNLSFAIWLLFAIALLIRLGFVIIQFEHNVMEGFSDDKLYMLIAEQIMKQGPVVADPGQIPMDVVGYGLPMIMAFLMAVFGKSWLTLFVANAIISTATIWLIMRITRKLFNLKAAFWAVLMGTFYVLFIKYLPTAGKETWIIFLFLTTIYFFINILKGRKIYTSVFFMALVYALLIHIDERFFAFIPVFAVVMVFWQRNYSKNFGVASLWIFLVILLMLPWLIRNYQVYDKIVILSKRTTVFTDPIFGYESKRDDTGKGMMQKFYLSEAQIDSVIQGNKQHFDSGRKIPKEQIAAMKQGIIPYKFNKVESIWQNTIEFLKIFDIRRNYIYNGYRYSGIWSFKHNLAVALTYGLILLLSGLSLIIAGKTDKKWLWFFGALFIYYTFVHSVLMGWAVNRYHVHLDALIIIMASYTLYYMVNYFLKRN